MSEKPHVMSQVRSFFSTKLLTSLWASVFFALLFGIAGTFSFSPFHFWPAAILSLFGLLSLTLNRSIKQSGLIGFCWGLGLFGSGISWVYVSIFEFGGMSAPISLFIVLLLVAYLSLYVLLFSCLLVALCPQTTWWRSTLAAPVLWQITEYLRRSIFTGFPWLQFGYTQIQGPLQGIAPILGVEGITFILMIVTGLLIYAWHERLKSALLLALAFLFLPWPLRYLDWFTPEPKKAVQIALVQGNIDQSIKMDINSINDILQIYKNETLPDIDKASIIIWPESAIPDIEKNQKKFLKEMDELFRKHHSSLITGILGEKKSSAAPIHDLLFNKVIVIGQKNPYEYPAINSYEKHHLVPFGESIPFENILNRLTPFFNRPMSSFSSGRYKQAPLNVKGLNVITAICYEIILGQQIRDNFKPNTDFLLTISNDAWFGHSIGPWQHFQMARMRALELGRPLLRVTNTGVTALIGPRGDILAKLPQFTRQVLSATLIPTYGITPYARFGIWPLCSVTLIMGGIAFYCSLHTSFWLNQKGKREH